MILPDVNVLVSAARDDAQRHVECRRLLIDSLAARRPVALPDFVVSGFLRVITHPRIFTPPTAIADALEFIASLRANASVVLLQPGPAHWDIFAGLCRAVEARGNLIPDAYLAALAIEQGAELVSADRDFTRFPGLRWRHPS
ncbi:MAG: type II toxin-antitoxin system VapC family toxin [Gemmatimonadaceae bacterium]